MSGSLLGSANRPKDVNKYEAGSDSDKISLALPKQYSTEDDAIDALLGAVGNYSKGDSKPDYALFPSGDERNSNGFISGLLEATGFDVPEQGQAVRGGRGCGSSCQSAKRLRQNMDNKITRDVPGFNLPVSKENFE